MQIHGDRSLHNEMSGFFLDHCLTTTYEFMFQLSFKRLTSKTKLSHQSNRRFLKITLKRNINLLAAGNVELELIYQIWLICLPAAGTLSLQSAVITHETRFYDKVSPLERQVQDHHLNLGWRKPAARFDLTEADARGKIASHLFIQSGLNGHFMLTVN